MWLDCKEMSLSDLNLRDEQTDLIDTVSQGLYLNYKRNFSIDVNLRDEQAEEIDAVR